MSGYVCRCEVCKAERKARRDAKAAEALLIAEARRTLRAQALADQCLGENVRARCQCNQDATWRSQDGREMRVQSMSRAHLLYALAKSDRGEYGANSWADQRRHVLESELLRRLTEAL